MGVAMTPSPWALERAALLSDSLLPVELGADDELAIAAALDAARRDGAERMQARVLDALDRGVYAIAARKCAAIDPARVLAGEDGRE